ncbi:filaggrin-2 [Microtus ochrogaster]|uniref:Filaggrin-2 n=1 Tax=Microtus ochrogaster TaxID=79684 RepID=A0ABM1USR8_MICOH|nr:filaggrin-2 [Microtus ochrogaster]
MTDLLRSVVTVIDIFYKYTKQDGECGTLSKDELKELLEKEFRPILKNPDDPDKVDVIMHMLDRDHDRRLDFTEFLLMVFKLAMACNKVLGKEYCKASGSKKPRHGHQNQKEESETEEEEEIPRRKSGFRHSSWSEGEEHGHSSSSSWGSAKPRRRSNSRRLERHSELSSSEEPRRKHHGSSSGQSWSSNKERHGSSSEELEEKRNKSHGRSSREAGEEYESGSRLNSQGRKGHSGLSHGLEKSKHESNSTQSRKGGEQKLGPSSASSENSKTQSHACGHSNSSGCCRPQSASSSCQASPSGRQGSQSCSTQSRCQSGTSGGQGYGCVSGGQSSRCCQAEPRSCSQSSSQRGYGCGHAAHCGRQQSTSSHHSSCCGSGATQHSGYGQHGGSSCGHSSSSQQKGCCSNEHSKCGHHGSGSGQPSCCEQHGTNSRQSSGFKQHGHGSGQSCCGQHGTASGQSSGCGQHGQHASGSGQLSGCDGQGSGSGQSSSTWKHGSGPSQSSGYGRQESGSGQSYSSGQHEQTPVHPESSEGEEHSVVSRRHSESSQSHGGHQHGESGSAVHGSQRSPQRQSRDSSRQSQYGHEETSHSGATKGAGGPPVHSESSKGEEHTVVSRRYSGSTKGHGGLQHGVSGSTIHRSPRGSQSQSRDSSRQPQSGHAEASESRFGRSPRESPVHSDSSEHEEHSVASRRYSGSTKGHVGLQSHRDPKSQHGELGYSRTATHSTHWQSRDGLSKQSSNTHIQSDTRHYRSHSTGNQYSSSQHWRHGSYGREDYDYGQSGYGPSEGSRTSSRNSSPLRSSYRTTHTQVSRYGQSFSLSHPVGSKANEGMGELVLKYRESDTDHEQPVDHYNLTGSSKGGTLVSSLGHSGVTSEHLNDCDFKYRYSLKEKQETTQNQPVDQSVFGHSRYILFQDNSESSSIGNQSGFSTNKSQVYNHGQSNDSYQLSSDSRNRNQRSSLNSTLQSLSCMGTEECNYLPCATTSGEGRQGQEPGSDSSGTIRIYSQIVDDKETRDSESIGYHEKGEVNSASAYIDSNTPLYTYVQEQKYHYFY